MRSPWSRLGIGMALVGAVFALQAAAWLLGPWLGPTATAALAATLAAGGGSAAFLLVVRRLERRPVTEFGGRGALRECAAGLATGAALFGATIGVLALAGCYSAVPTGRADAMLIPLFVSVGSAVLEEVMFRGLLFRLVEEARGTWVALAVSSTVFGVAHLANPGATLLAAVAIAIEAGVLLGAAFLATRRLWLAIGLHAGWNFAQSGIFGVPNSGLQMEGLLRGRLEGPAWLSGGAFGVEASIVALAVCGSAGIAMLWRARRAGRIVPRPQRRLPVAAGSAGRSA